MTSIIVLTSLLIFTIMILIKFPLSPNVKKLYLLFYTVLLISLFIMGYKAVKPMLYNKKATAKISVKTQEEPKRNIEVNKIPSANEAKTKILTHTLINVPNLSQLPELPRGCEVTSLAMLFRFGGINVNKLELAKKVKYSTTPYKKVGGKIYFGDPNDGFVGNMYTFKKPGLGVYHKPIYNLANTYFPNKIINLTGKDFSTLMTHLSKGKPIWIIINTTYQPLKDSSFQTWYTPNGPIKITYKEHSVLITGYDKTYIYFNDPLTGVKNKKLPKQQFIDAWIQMGSQAITFK